MALGVGEVLGVVGVAGIPATLALTMPATTKREFQFLKGCLLVSGALIIASLFFIDWRDDLTSLHFRAVINAAVAAILAGGLTYGINWLGKKQESFLGAAKGDTATTSAAAKKNGPNISAGHDVNIGHIGDVINQIAPEIPKIDLSKYEGVLMPGNFPTPPLPQACRRSVPSDALTLFWGSNASWNVRLPHTLLEIAGEPMIVADKNDQGNLVITLLKVFDDRNDVIARIDEDGFWVQNNVRKKRPDESTLVVFDHTDTEVLRIQYLNSRAISVQGLFRHPKISPIYWHVRQGNAVQMPNNNSFNGNCVGNLSVSIRITERGAVGMGGGKG
jgi:hypothetical protein